MEFRRINNSINLINYIGRIPGNMVQLFKESVFNVPNVLSAFRIFMIIPFVISFLKEDYVLSLLILCISGITDVLDGVIARETNQITKLGKILDPIADKLTLIAVAMCLSIKFPEIIPFVSVLLIKDLAMLIAGGVFVVNGMELPQAKWYGKISTLAFYVSVITLVLLKEVYCIDCAGVTMILFSVTTIFMVFALFKYFMLCLNLLKS